jgi:cytochrome P450
VLEQNRHDGPREVRHTPAGTAVQANARKTARRGKRGQLAAHAARRLVDGSAPGEADRLTNQELNTLASLLFLAGFETTD